MLFFYDVINLPGLCQSAFAMGTYQLNFATPNPVSWQQW
jgi:hypothetical protein